MMEKEEYIKLTTTEPWKEMQDHFDALPIVNSSPITQLTIDTDKWIKFSIDNFHLAKQRYEKTEPHYHELANKWSLINTTMGRNIHNSLEINYGMFGDTNEQLKDILGLDNIRLTGMNPDTLLIRLIVKFPGHGQAWHADFLESHASKFTGIDKTKVRRFWFSVDDWQDGHALQISKTVVTNWNKGAVYNIPKGVGHASGNFGYRPMYTVSFTGVLDS